MTAFVPLAIGIAIILSALKKYRRHLKVEARVCRDVRQVLARIAPLSDAIVAEPADTAAAVPQPDLQG